MIRRSGVAFWLLFISFSLSLVSLAADGEGGEGDRFRTALKSFREPGKVCKDKLYLAACLEREGLVQNASALARALPNPVLSGVRSGNPAAEDSLRQLIVQTQKKPVVDDDDSDDGDEHFAPDDEEGDGSRPPAPKKKLAAGRKKANVELVMINQGLAQHVKVLTERLEAAIARLRTFESLVPFCEVKVDAVGGDGEELRFFLTRPDRTFFLIEGAHSTLPRLSATVFQAVQEKGSSLTPDEVLRISAELADSAVA